MTKQPIRSPQVRPPPPAVRGAVDEDHWATILKDAAALADASEARQLKALAQRLQQQRLRVLVAGEAKRGKSTLVNALLGRPLLPTGVTPLTSVATTVTAAEPGSQEDAEVFFAEGTRQRIALDRLTDFVTEPGNPGNAAGVAGVTVYLHNTLLDRYHVDFVDTPGTGSVYTHNTTDARQALSSLDAAILVLTADPPISDAERQLLAEIARTSVRTFVLLNKSDRMSIEDSHEAEAFTRRVCSEATGSDVTVQSCSARRGHDDHGFTAFSTALKRYLDTRADQDVQLALRGHLTRTLQVMVDSRRVRLRGLELAAEGQTLDLKDLQSRLRAVAGRRTDINDRCSGSLRRLRVDLDSSADAVVPRFTLDCRRRLDDVWESQLGSVSPTDVEEQARSLVIDFLTHTVDTWREHRTADLEAGLAGVVEQAQADIATQVQLAHDAIQDVLAIRLHSNWPEPVLQVDTTFHYDFTRPEGWQLVPPLHTAMSRLGTGARRRRRARQVVTAEIPTLTDRQVGRARWDLQHRLQESGRAIGTALHEQFTQTVDVFLELLEDLTHEGDQDRAGQATEYENVATATRSLEAWLTRVSQG